MSREVETHSLSGHSHFSAGGSRWLDLDKVISMVRYFLKKKNVLADQLSNLNQVLPTEWSFLPWVFNTICEVHGHPYIDLFATRADGKLILYVSRVPDPVTWKQDAFQH